MTAQEIRDLPRHEFWPAFFALTEVSQEHWLLAADRAGAWTKCACCELREERRIRGLSAKDARLEGAIRILAGGAAPINRKLETKGNKFSRLIELREFDNAKRLYARIQEMVAEENRLAAQAGGAA